jgi:hypothetical protein
VPRTSGSVVANHPTTGLACIACRAGQGGAGRGRSGHCQSGSFGSPAKAHDGILPGRQRANHGLQRQRRRIRSVECATHYIENTRDTDLVFLETFASEDVSLNEWLRRVPSEMLKAHLNIDKATAMKYRRRSSEPSKQDYLGQALCAQPCAQRLLIK